MTVAIDSMAVDTLQFGRELGFGRNAVVLQLRASTAGRRVRSR